MSCFRFIWLALLFSGSATAGPLRFSAGLWDYEVTGYEIDNGVRRDFQRDLAVQPGSNLRLALEFDWREDWWPDLAASYDEFGGEGRVSTPNGGGLLGGGATTITSTRADLAALGLVARWPLPLGDFTF